MPHLVRALATAFLALTFAGGFAPASETPAPLELRPDPAAPRRVWDGWGVSLCWWAKVFGDRDELADAFFTTRDSVRVESHELPGLGLTIARYNAGACSWNEVDGRRMAVSKIIRPYRQMESFWLDPRSSDPDSASWDWSVDAKQRAALLKARDRGADRFELFSNSPPWWMLANANPSGAADKFAENLPSARHDDFATYLAAIAGRAKTHWGISFTTVEPFNEPVSGYWFDDCKQEGAYFSASAQAAFLPRLRAALDARGLPDLPIAASDETSYTHALQTWESFSPATRALVGQVNVHGYEGAKGPRRALHEAVVTRDRKPLWNSEYGETHADGLTMARCLHLDFHELRPSAWNYWQALDQGGWGLIAADLSAAKIQHPNPKYHVLAQYSRHLRPGMTVFEGDDASAITAYSAIERRLALVVFNDGPARPARFDLSAFAAPDQPVASWLTSPKAAARYAPQPPLPLTQGRFETTLPADSVQSFELHDVVLR